MVAEEEVPEWPSSPSWTCEALYCRFVRSVDFWAAAITNCSSRRCFHKLSHFFHSHWHIPLNCCLVFVSSAIDSTVQKLELLKFEISKFYIEICEICIIWVWETSYSVVVLVQITFYTVVAKLSCKQHFWADLHLPLKVEVGAAKYRQQSESATDV